MQRPAHRERGGVDRVHLVPGRASGRSGTCPRPPSGRPTSPRGPARVGLSGTALDMIPLPYWRAAPARHRIGRHHPARAAPARAGVDVRVRSDGLRRAHLGHGRFNVAWDVLRRYLAWSGLDVRFVSNVTDIDDKIIARAAVEGRAPEAVAADYEQVWWDTMARLGVEARPTRRTPPPTCEHMIDLIEQAASSGGHAYVGGDGVYFARRERARLWPAGPPAHREPSGRRPGGGGRGGRQAIPDRFRPLEGGQAG